MPDTSTIIYMNDPVDIAERRKAINTNTSVLVKAPAGSGKTTLLTQRFLALLATVDDPKHIVAITFTIAAAAEMRHRILDALAKASHGNSNADPLALAALDNATSHGWDLLAQPALLRISTIDSFCRELALQQPLLSGLGGGLAIADLPVDLYRDAARLTLAEIDHGPEDLKLAIEELLQWRGNDLRELEEHLITMLGVRDRWMQDFVFDRELDETVLRAGLERPFGRAVVNALDQIESLLSISDWSEISSLAQFACGELAGQRFSALAGASFPSGPYSVDDETALADSLAVYQDLVALLMTNSLTFRQKITKNEGFPTTAKLEKARIVGLIQLLSGRPGFSKALCGIDCLPPLHFNDDDWRIIRACFVLLRYAAAHLKGIFAKVGKVDFVEVAQIAQLALTATEGAAGEGAFAIADGIHHLLVDEVQDTSRRQHNLLAGIVSNWEDRTGRTCFVVGDPLQSIYAFRDADIELFSRAENVGLDLPGDEQLSFDLAQLASNFRTAAPLVNRLNDVFGSIFAIEDGSGLQYTPANPGRKDIHHAPVSGKHFNVHLEFVPASALAGSDMCQQAKQKQVASIVELIASYQPLIEAAAKHHEKFRIAVLGRARKALIPIAVALREAGIPYRAIDLEPLAERSEVIDALQLARALLNEEDRVAWLGVLRAPWCGLSLAELYLLTSADDPLLLTQPVRDLAEARIDLLPSAAIIAVRRVLDATADAAYLRASQPTQALGTWLETVWLRLGGDACVDAQSRSNLDLLWSTVDQLSNAEQDLVGPALESALGKLMAQPDPAASNDHGVQILTIHKSKGLEYEVVIVPELQAHTGMTRSSMLSWCERGVSDGGAITEFLVAPNQAKGADGGATKKWVDSIYRERETQEMRRLLYVAATRAREELHFFARPGYKEAPDGSRTIAAPTGNLLAVAWPAIEGEVLTQFLTWQPSSSAGPAVESENVAVDLPTRILRLGPDFTSNHAQVMGIALNAGDSSLQPYSRESGAGVESRVRGRAIHSLLRMLTVKRASQSWEQARLALAEEKPRLVAQIRSSGIARGEAMRLADGAFDVALATTNDPIGRWLLDPHLEGESEVPWTGLIGGEIRNVQADRVFRAGEAPMEEGSDVFWIVDYKTGVQMPEGDPQVALAASRALYSPQLETYARVLRQIRGGSITIRAGLYYPAWAKLDSWELPAN
jgi:ATP-dependent exoDNAse (exonuclease V) beta subunit